MRVTVSMSLILVLILWGNMYAQSTADDVPPWLIFEQGKKELEHGEYGKALHLFQKALDLKPTYPEVELAMGDIYRAEGESLLADKQYRKAYELKSFFLVPEDRFTALYRLVELQRSSNESEKLEETLQTLLRDGIEAIDKKKFEGAILRWVTGKDNREFILDIYRFDEEAGMYHLKKNPDPGEQYKLRTVLRSVDHENYYFDVFEFHKGLFLKTYLERGLDKLLQLYRLDHREMARAHGEMGEIYNRKMAQGLAASARPVAEAVRMNEQIEDDCKAAITHYLFALVILLSDALEEMRFLDPGYRFTSIADFLQRCEKKEHLMGFLTQKNVFGYFYYLAVATQALGEEARSGEIWQYLRDEPYAGRYVSLAKKQLVSPWILPLLYID